MLFIPATLDSVGLEILVPQEGTLPPGAIVRVLLNYKPRLLLEHFDLLVARDQQKRAVTLLAGAPEPDHQEEVKLLLRGATQ